MGLTRLPKSPREYGGRGRVTGFYEIRKKRRIIPVISETSLINPTFLINAKMKSPVIRIPGKTIQSGRRRPDRRGTRHIGQSMTKTDTRDVRTTLPRSGAWKRRLPDRPAACPTRGREASKKKAVRLCANRRHPLRPSLALPVKGGSTASAINPGNIGGVKVEES